MNIEIKKPKQSIFDLYVSTGNLGFHSLEHAIEQPNTPEAQAIRRDLEIVQMGIKAFEEEVWIEGGLGHRVLSAHGKEHLYFSEDFLLRAFSYTNAEDAEKIRIILQKRDFESGNEPKLVLDASSDQNSLNGIRDRIEIEEIKGTATEAIGLVNRARKLQRLGKLDIKEKKEPEYKGWF